MAQQQYLRRLIPAAFYESVLIRYRRDFLLIVVVHALREPSALSISRQPEEVAIGLALLFMTRQRSY